MALTIGTDAYSSLADVRAYWVARGDTAWALLADADAEVFIRQGTDYIDRGWSYIGDKSTGPQRLKWPRKFAYVEGFELADDEIPWQVSEATAIMADVFRLGTFDTEGIVTNDDAAISMQKVDVITVQYDTAKRLQGKSVMSHVYELLGPVTAGGGGLLRA